MLKILQNWVKPLTYYSCFRLQATILATCMLVLDTYWFFWTQIPAGCLNRNNCRTQKNLLTRKQTYAAHCIFLFYIIFDGFTILLDHLLTTDSWLYLTLTVSLVWDTLTLVTLPTMVILNSRYSNHGFWVRRDFKVKKLEFKIIRGPLLIKRDYGMDTKLSCGISKLIIVKPIILDEGAGTSRNCQWNEKAKTTVCSLPKVVD